MPTNIKLRVSESDINELAGLLDKRGKEIKVRRGLLSKLVCDYGILFDYIDKERVLVKEKVDP